MAIRRDVTVDVLDGQHTIGGSKILVGWDGTGTLLDFGINYARMGQYYEEFVKPRSAQGLGDLWKLDLIPQVRDLYRPDVIPPGLSPGRDLAVREISGIYLSHAHLDHAGLIGLLQPSLPLVCSRTTAAILKGVQDTGKSDIFSQTVYASPVRMQQVGGQAVLKGDPSAPHVGRRTFLTDGTGTSGFHRFWNEPPSRAAENGGKNGKGKGLRAGELAVHQSSSGGVPTDAFVVDHSVLGSSAFILESPQGSIAYSGDIRSHGEHGPDTRSFFNSLKRRPPWILLIEGTQVRQRDVDDEALGRPTPENEVEENCRRAVEAHAGQTVIADFAPRNIERLKAFARIARQTGRRLVILPKDAYLLHAMHAANDSVPEPCEEILVYDPPAASEGAWERFVRTQYEPFIIRSEEVRRRQTELILCLSYWDVKHLLDIEPERGCYIYSSSEAFNEEMEIDMERLHNWLVRFHLKPVGFHMVPLPGKRRHKPVFHDGYHSSGHMPGDEVLEWVRDVNPENVVPLHTDEYDLFRQRLEAMELKVWTGGAS